MIREKLRSHAMKNIDENSLCCTSVDEFFKHFEVLTSRREKAGEALDDIYDEGAILLDNLLAWNNMDDAKKVVEALPLSEMFRAQVVDEAVPLHEKFHRRESKRNHSSAIYLIFHALGNHEHDAPLTWYYKEACFKRRHENPYLLQWRPQLCFNMDCYMLMLVPHERRLSLLWKFCSSHLTSQCNLSFQNAMAIVLAHDQEFCEFLLADNTQMESIIALCGTYETRDMFLYKMLWASKHRYFDKRTHQLVCTVYYRLPNPRLKGLIVVRKEDLKRRYENFRLFLILKRAKKHFSIPAFVVNVIMKLTGTMENRCLTKPFFQNF